MSDVVSYSMPVKKARSSAVLSLIDAAIAAGKLTLYSGSRPAVSDLPPDTSLLEMMLANPCGVVNDQAEIVFSPVADAMVASSGVATWARMSDGDGNAVADFDVGLPGSGAAIVMTDTDLKAGSLIRVTLAKLIEP